MKTFESRAKELVNALNGNYENGLERLAEATTKKTMKSNDERIREMIIRLGGKA